MSAASLLSSLKEKPTDESPKNGSDQSGEEMGGGSECGAGDPAVLVVGPARRPLVYSRETLLRLRNSPLVKQGLEHAFKGCDALALVLKKRSDSPNDDDRGAKGDAPNENHKNGPGAGGGARERRSADPRERVRRESEGSGIVLSPQRRSFTSGCGAPAPPHARPDSPHSAHAPAAGKTADQAGRRIGSGRIMVREAGGWDDPDFREVYRPPRDRAAADRFERRSFGRDSFSSDMKREDRFGCDKPRDREESRRSGGRYSHRRYDKEEEPEWFSGGPTSQLETIELRGFDDPPKKNGNATAKETEKWSGGAGGGSKRRAEAEAPVASAAQEEPTPAASVITEPEPVVEDKQEDMLQCDEQPEFNLDEFLKFDTIPDVLTNGGGGAEGGSRFSQWFRREQTSPETPHFDAMLHHVLDDSESTRDTMGVEAARGFTPISPGGALAPPAHLVHPQHHAHSVQPPQPHQPFSLLDLMFRANQKPREAASALGAGGLGGGGGKMQSLEELEARLRPHHSAPHHPAPHHNVSEHDLTAFKRLLAQVSGGHAVAAEQRAPPPHQPQPQPMPMTLLQMLNKSMEQQQQQQQQQQKVQQQQHQQQQQPPHIPQELLYKLLQVQQRQQQQQQQQGELSAQSAADRELLQRPEAQAIIHGLKAGEITVQHLMQQLGNPGLQSRHRELLLTILRLHQQHRQQQMGGSPLPGSGPMGSVGAPHLVLPHHQPLRLSPLPHPAFCSSPIMATSPNTLTVHHTGDMQSGVPARIPSPRELAAHTQSIMQGALIKKKLEEQRENYRRRHEMQHAKQPTPISFTPTSVLRKMTADKEAEAPSPKLQQQWQPLKMPQGRPIVKGNQSGAPPTIGFTQTPPDYQHHYVNQHQQMVGSVRSFPHTQQRQHAPAAQQYSNMSGATRAGGGGTTLQQLLMHSHHRSLNEMGGGSGGGDNQLARWFSPELLARASAGKLPSVHVPNALSLEELERHHAPQHPPAHPAHPAQPVRN